MAVGSCHLCPSTSVDHSLWRRRMGEFLTNHCLCACERDRDRERGREGGGDLKEGVGVGGVGGGKGGGKAICSRHLVTGPCSSRSGMPKLTQRPREQWPALRHALRRPSERKHLHPTHHHHHRSPPAPDLPQALRSPGLLSPFIRLLRVGLSIKNRATAGNLCTELLVPLLFLFLSFSLSLSFSSTSTTQLLLWI